MPTEWQETSGGGRFADEGRRKPGRATNGRCRPSWCRRAPQRSTADSGTGGSAGGARGRGDGRWPAAGGARHPGSHADWTTGVGKTRLAIAAAVAAAPRFADGVSFVDLTGVRDPALVPAAVLAAVGADQSTPRTADQLGRVLTEEHLLLVIDNFEQVLDAGPSIAAALAGSAGLRLLLTSRERLHLRAEREMAVRPLRLPREGDDLAHLAAAPAMEMLVQCVRRFEPEFEVTPANQEALVEICTRLDGLPLALELAAARLKLFTPGELTFRLRHRMSILTGTVRDAPPRHRTLRAALKWSHDLLKPDERAAFRRISVFVGGATLDAAGEVCALGDPVATITSLVDKSLLQRRARPDGVAEFVMLESLREYAGVLLAEHGEQEALDARHARYFADLAVLVDTAVGEAGPARSAEWAESVRLEQGNLRKALAYAMAVADARLSLPLAAALGWYASVRAQAREAQPASHRIPAEPQYPPAPGDSLSHALLAATAPALGQGDLDEVEVLLTRVLAVDEDTRCTAIATAVLGHVARARGHHDRAVSHHAQAADLFGALGDLSGLAWSRYDQAVLARLRGDAVGAAGHLRESQTRFRETGDARALACATWALMTTQTHHGRPDAAERQLVEARGCCSLARGRARYRGVPRRHVSGRVRPPRTRRDTVGPRQVPSAADVGPGHRRARSRETRRPGHRTGAPAPRVAPRRRASRLAVRGPIAHDAGAAGGAPGRRRVDEPPDRSGARDRREDHRGARSQHHPQARRPEPGGGGGPGERFRRDGLSTGKPSPYMVLPIPGVVARGVGRSWCESQGGDHGRDRGDDVLCGRGQVRRGLLLQRRVPLLGRRGPGQRHLRLDPGLLRRLRHRRRPRRLRPLPVPVRAHTRQRAGRELACRPAGRRPLQRRAARGAARRIHRQARGTDRRPGRTDRRGRGRRAGPDHL